MISRYSSAANTKVVHSCAGRRAPADTEVDELIDEDVFLDRSPAKPLDSRLATRPVPVDYTSAVAPFRTEATSLLLDSSSEENPAAWVQRCPRHHQTAEACVVQRAGYRTLAVLDVQGVIALQVRQLRCIKHGLTGPGANDFFVTAPSVFQQIRAYGVIMQPRIECLTASVVVTRAAYECALEYASTLQAHAMMLLAACLRLTCSIKQHV